MNSAEVKALLRSLGADLCGIASVDRFAQAPEGYHPLDTMPTCRSVIAFACRFPAGTLECKNAVPYTRVRNSITARMDQIALEACMCLEAEGHLAAPIPTNESEWDEKTQRWRSIVSLKHAAQAAGLGAIGRHSLLITPELGSMVWLGAILTEAALEADPLLGPLCQGCQRCVEACPIHALDHMQMDQNACWDYAFGDEPDKQRWSIHCHACRNACPYNLPKEMREP